MDDIKKSWDWSQLIHQGVKPFRVGIVTESESESSSIFGCTLPRGSRSWEGVMPPDDLGTMTRNCDWKILEICIFKSLDVKRSAQSMHFLSRLVRFVFQGRTSAVHCRAFECRGPLNTNGPLFGMGMQQFQCSGLILVGLNGLSFNRQGCVVGIEIVFSQ